MVLCGSPTSPASVVTSAAHRRQAPAAASAARTSTLTVTSTFQDLSIAGGNLDKTSPQSW